MTTSLVADPVAEQRVDGLVASGDLALEGFLLMRRLGFGQLLVQVEHPFHEFDRLVIRRRQD